MLTFVGSCFEAQEPRFRLTTCSPNLATSVSMERMLLAPASAVRAKSAHSTMHEVVVIQVWYEMIAKALLRRSDSQRESAIQLPWPCQCRVGV
jgi:hypothetical protein